MQGEVVLTMVILPVLLFRRSMRRASVSLCFLSLKTPEKHDQVSILPPLYELDATYRHPSRPTTPFRLCPSPSCTPCS